MNSNKPLLKEINQRKSVRAFLDKPIEPEKLDALWAAAQWAPSSSNKQEWHYYAFIGKARERLESVLSRGNHWSLKAPLLLAVARDTSIENKAESREYGMYDVALSVMNLVIEAEHQGLKSHQMAGFKEEEFKKVTNLPANQAPVVMVAVGYEGDVESLDERTKEKELASERTRKEISEIVTVISD